MNLITTRTLSHFALLVIGFHPIAAVADTPNVIYILADDLGYGDLSCYGQEKFATPNIDRIAAEGLLFTDHYSGNTVCSPSRAVLMTGLHSGHCYLRGNVSGEKNAELPEERRVLAEVFQQAGYATGGYGKWGLGHTHVPGPKSPLNHGFNHFFGWKSQTIAHTYYPSSVVDDGEEIPLEPGTFVHDMIMDRARQFIRTNAEADRPFFCYIPTAVPHAAMHAPAELHQKWRKQFPQFDDVIGKYGAGPDDPCPDVKNPIAGFAAMMENLDLEVGSILTLLDELGIAENTVVMFSSDNGAHKEGGHRPEFWNSTGSLRGHKRDMHEGGIRSPMLARWPSEIEAGRTTDHISGFQDVLPTMAALLDQPVPEDVDGLSFLPTLRDEPQPAHDYLYFEFRKGANQKVDSKAVRMGQWKAFRKTGRQTELYNLDDDPYEQDDIAGQHADVVRKVETIMTDASSPLSR